MVELKRIEGRDRNASGVTGVLVAQKFSSLDWNAAKRRSMGG